MTWRTASPEVHLSIKSLLLTVQRPQGQVHFILPYVEWRQSVFAGIAGGQFPLYTKPLLKAETHRSPGVGGGGLALAEVNEDLFGMGVPPPKTHINRAV